MRLGKTRWSVRLKFEKRDAWIGVYWDTTRDTYGRTWLAVFVCALPFLPVVLNRAPASWYTSGVWSASRWWFWPGPVAWLAWGALIALAVVLR